MMVKAQRINNKQKALLHIAKSQLCLEEDIYRTILEQFGGVESSKDMTPEGFDRVMARFEELGFQPSTRYQRQKAASRGPGSMVTPAQQKKIDDLYAELGWDAGNRRIGFNKRVIRKPWPQTRAEANKIIEALKSMLARGYDAE